MNATLAHPFIAISNTRDYAKDLAAMKRTAAKAKKDPAYAMRLVLSTGMYTKAGKLKKQFQ